MPDSQNPEHVRKLIAEFQLKGANLIPTVTAEIVPTVVIADLSVDVRAEDRWGVGAVKGPASGAGNQNLFDITNAPNSGVIIYVDAFWVVGQAIDNVGIEIITPGATGGNTSWRDSRQVGAPLAGVSVVAVAAAALPATSFNVAVLSVPMPINYVLRPDTRLRFRQDAQNTAMDFAFFFRERDIRPGE